MDDKKNSTDETSEYKFVESETAETPVESGVEEQPGVEPVEETKFTFKFNLKNINWRRLAVPGAIVLSILLVYTIFSFYTSNKTRTLEQQKTMVQEKAATMGQQPIEPMIASSPMTVGQGVSSDQLTQIQNVMQQKVDNMSQQVANSQSNISSLNDTVSRMQQDIYNIGQQVEQLTAAMQQMLAEIEKLQPPVKTKKRVARLPVAYHVRAIVPGRVWLESANGRNVTLRVGNTLAGYGVVQAISPRKGMVVMSNGSIIQYGVNDF